MLLLPKAKDRMRDPLVYLAHTENIGLIASMPLRHGVSIASKMHTLERFENT